MRNAMILLVIMIAIIPSCSKEKCVSPQRQNSVPSNLLTLKVDFLTNKFEGGKETAYNTNSTTFTITNEYDPPLDFGNIKLRYKELNEIIFDGDIIWMGRGEIRYPQNLLPASDFDTTTSNIPVLPSMGFENVFKPYNDSIDYIPIWNSVQKLTKVREYLNSNKNASVKLFLYTPSVGIGNPADWDWIIFMKD